MTCDHSLGAEFVCRIFVFVVGLAMTDLQPTGPSTSCSVRRRARLVALVFVFLWFLIGGIAHFVATDIETRIVPPYIPWPRVRVLISGVFELLGATALLYPPIRSTAGVGLFALTIAVTPAHIYMLQRSDLFDVPYWVLVLRLPLQVALLFLIAWSSIVPYCGSHSRKSL